MPAMIGDIDVERLGLLAEEMGEALQAVGKCMRHGMTSTDPTVAGGPTNAEALAREVGDVLAAIELLITSGHVPRKAIVDARAAKLAKLPAWLHTVELGKACRAYPYRVSGITDRVLEEVSNAMRQHPRYNTAHEGASVLREEFEELWDEVKKKSGERSNEHMEAEAIQVAAVAIRFVHDITAAASRRAAEIGGHQ